MRFWRNLVRSTAAVVLGNLLYFYLLMPYLPPRAQHVPKQFDWGLVIDFWVCVAVWGVIAMATRPQP